MTNSGILSQFFNERISAVDGSAKPLLQRLKNVCEKRASGQISEQKAFLEIEKITGQKFSPVVSGLNFGSQSLPLFSGLENVKQKPVMNLLAGARTNLKKPVLQDFNLGNKKEQFPVLGLKPLNNKPGNKKFIVSPASRTWFDVKQFAPVKPVIQNFKQPQKNSSGVLGELNFNKNNSSVINNFKSNVFTHRMNESNKAMKNMLSAAKQNIGSQPVLGGMVSHMNPRQGQRKFPKRKQSVFEMMGGKQ